MIHALENSYGHFQDIVCYCLKLHVSLNHLIIHDHDRKLHVLLTYIHHLRLGNLLEASLVAVKRLRVAAKRVLRVELPESMRLPASRQLTNLISVPGHRQRALTERGAAARAGVPPVGRRVDERVDALRRLVRLDKVRDPRHHVVGREAVAGVALGRVLNVEHAGERDAVVGPPAAVADKVLGLLGAARRRGLAKVVAAAEEAGGRGALVVRAEGRVDVRGALGGLENRQSAYE